MGLDEAVRKEVLRRHEIRRRKRLYLELLGFVAKKIEPYALTSLGPLAIVDLEKYEEFFEGAFGVPKRDKKLFAYGENVEHIAETSKWYARVKPERYLEELITFTPGDTVINGYYGFVAGLETIAEHDYEMYRAQVTRLLTQRKRHSPILGRFFSPMAIHEPEVFIRVFNHFKDRSEKGREKRTTISYVFPPAIVTLATHHPQLFIESFDLFTYIFSKEEFQPDLAKALLVSDPKLIERTTIFQDAISDPMHGEFHCLFDVLAEYDPDRYVELLDEAVQEQKSVLMVNEELLATPEKIEAYFGPLAAIDLDKYLAYYAQLINAENDNVVEGAARTLEYLADADEQLYLQMVGENLSGLDISVRIDPEVNLRWNAKILQQWAQSGELPQEALGYSPGVKLSTITPLQRGTLNALAPLARIDPDVLVEIVKEVSHRGLIHPKILKKYLVSLSSQPEKFSELYESMLRGFGFVSKSYLAVGALSELARTAPLEYTHLVRKSTAGEFMFRREIASTLSAFAETMLEDDPTPVCDEYRTMVEELLARDVFDELTVDEIVEELDCLLDERVPTQRVLQVHEQGANQKMAHLAESAIVEIPGYQIIRYLGEGADGIVYQAEGEILGEVKIKIFKEPDERIKQAMIDEGVTLEGRIKRRIAAFDKAVRDKTYLTQTYEVGRCRDPRDGSDTIYTVSDYVDGGAIEVKVDGKYVVRDDITADTIPEIMRRVLLGLRALHSHGKILKDLKLGNVLLSANHQVLRIDDVETVSGLDEISAGARLSYGSDRYAAPEVMREGPSVYSIQSDMYAAGVFLLYLITRKPTLMLGINSIEDEQKYNSALEKMLEEEGFVGDEITFFQKALSFNPDERVELGGSAWKFTEVFGILSYNSQDYNGVRSIFENFESFKKIKPQLDAAFRYRLSTALDFPWYLKDSRFEGFMVSPIRRIFEKE